MRNGILHSNLNEVKNARYFSQNFINFDENVLAFIIFQKKK